MPPRFGYQVPVFCRGKIVGRWPLRNQGSHLAPSLAPPPPRLSGDLEWTPPAYSAYDDFHTIDWQRDVQRDRVRHRKLGQRRRDGILHFLAAWMDSLSAWVCVTLVGLFAGCFAGKTGSRWEIVKSAFTLRPSHNSKKKFYLAESHKILFLLVMVSKQF